MFGIDPRLVALFCLVFIGLGIFNIRTGLKRMHEAQAQGKVTAWYKQVTVLTGVEYILLAVAFLISLGINSGWIPRSYNSAVIPFFIALLLSSCLLAGVVVYQGIAAARQKKVVAATPASSSSSITQSRPEMTPEQQALHRQKQRARRQKAAEARRRRAGKA